MGLVGRVLMVAALVAPLWLPGLVFSQEVDTLRVRKVGERYELVDDTMQVYHLGAVIVGSRPGQMQSANTYQRISLASIDQLDAANVSQLAPIIPSGYVQTNSRGESILYLRNTGERQLALFFDGALLNIPWDNRIDLDLMPSSALGNLTVSKGAASAAYGANVMGGAVNMVTRSLSSNGSFSEVDVHAGSGSLMDVTGVHMGKSNSLEYIAAVGYLNRDGITVSDDAELPYSQEDDALRTNTDMRRFNAFARAAYTTTDDYTFAITGSFIDAEKGIAPESNKDPALESVRYWRYPDWRNLMVIGSLVREIGGARNTGIRGAVWLNSFSQTIESYTTDQYDELAATQDDDDATVGGRFILSHRLYASEVRFSVNGTYSQHDQVEREDASLLEQNFKQLLGSTGVEADIRPGGPLWYAASLSLDMQAVPDADVFESPDPNLAVGGMLGVVLQASREWTARMSFGRKSRFPTMRERYAGALGRFVVNPDLASEKAILGEVGVRYGNGPTSAEVVFFTNLTSDTIDQDAIVVDGENKRIRVNLGGSRSYGVEGRVSARPVTGLLVEGNAMLNYQRAQDQETGDYDRRLTERPNMLLTVSGTYNHRLGFTAGLSAVYTGKAYSLDDAGEFVALDPSTSVNGRVGYRFLVGNAGAATIEVFGRVDNALDVVIENQLGLPGPGRSFLAGAKIGI